MNKEGLYAKARQQLRGSDTVLDIGGHVGLAAMYFASASRDVRVVSVEAAPRTFACLRANMERHVPGGIALHTAVAGSRGTRSFTFYENSPGNSGLFADVAKDDETTRRFLANGGVDEAAIEEIIGDLHVPTQLSVEAVTVSDLIDRHGVTSVGLLKVDVERAELEVVQGISDQHWPLIRYVVAEVHAEGGRLDALRSLLQLRGFEVSVTQDALLRGTELYDLDAVRTSSV